MDLTGKQILGMILNFLKLMRAKNIVLSPQHIIEHFLYIKSRCFFFTYTFL